MRVRAHGAGQITIADNGARAREAGWVHAQHALRALRGYLDVCAEPGGATAVVITLVAPCAP